MIFHIIISDSCINHPDICYIDCEVKFTNQKAKLILEYTSEIRINYLNLKFALKTN